eukprot:gene644-6001_t
MAARMDEIAAFLIGAGPYHYYGTGSWHGGPITHDPPPFRGHWVDGVFNRTLGEPLGDGVYDEASGEWSRGFKHGTRVTFNARTKKGTI